MQKIILNGFEVDRGLAELMVRPDWAMSRGKRALTNKPLTENSEAWLTKFKSAEDLGTSKGIYAIDFLSPDHAKLENEVIRDPRNKILYGDMNIEHPPGDFDPFNGYLIGMTCEVDEGIFVDLRPAKGPRITYSNHNVHGSQIVTAFESIDEFVAFYLKQHGTV